MAILTTLLIALLVLVCLLMVLIILMQRPKQEGLGAAFGGGMTDSMFGAQTTDVLQKGTTWLAVIFFCTTISLAAINARKFKTEADKGEGLISNDPAEVIPDFQAQMPDLSQGALDPNIPLPGAADSSATTTPGGAAESAPATTPGLELLPPPDAVDVKKPKPAAADKPAPAPTPAPEAGAKPATDTKPKPATETKPAPAPATEAAPTPASKPAPPAPTPAPAPAAESGQ